MRTIMGTLSELVLELTDLCPMWCSHCSSLSGPDCCKFLPWQVVRRLLHEAAELAVRQISFGGGEPTSAPCFLDAAREAVRLGLSTEAFTCGAMLSDRREAISFTREFVDEVAQIGPTFVFVFSIHGSMPETHDGITGVPGSFRLALASLSLCRQSGVACAANFVPLRPNVVDFPGVVSLLQSFGIEKLSVLRFVPQGRGAAGRQALMLSSEEERLFVGQLLHQRRIARLQIRTGSPFNGIVPGNMVPCRAGFRKLVVQPDGNVIPCEVFKDERRQNWGASTPTATLRQILALRQFGELRSAIIKSGCGICPVHGLLVRTPYRGQPNDVAKEFALYGGARV